MDCEDLSELKPIIRGIVLMLGRETNQYEFEKQYREQEGEPFDTVLRKLNVDFYSFMRSIPDVIRVQQKAYGYALEVVTTEQTAHMKDLTINKFKIRRDQQNRVVKNSGFRYKNNGFTKPFNRPFQRKEAFNKPLERASVKPTATITSSRFSAISQLSKLRSRAADTLSELRPGLSRQNRPAIVPNHKASANGYVPKHVAAPKPNLLAAQKPSPAVKPLVAPNDVEIPNNIVVETKYKRPDGTVVVIGSGPSVRPNLPIVIYKQVDKVDKVDKAEKLNGFVDVQSKARRLQCEEKVSQTMQEDPQPVPPPEATDKVRGNIEMRYFNSKIAIVTKLNSWEESQKKLMAQIGSTTKPLVFYQPKNFTEVQKDLLRESQQRLGAMMNELVEERKKETRQELVKLDDQMKIDLKAYDESHLIKKGLLDLILRCRHFISFFSCRRVGAKI